MTRLSLRSVVLAALSGGAWLLLPAGQAHAERLCVKWEIRTEDSGMGIQAGPNAGGTEDKYPGANAGATASALGVRVRISRPGWAQTYDTAPGSGCVDWSDSSWSGDYDVRVYGYQTDANDNVVRIHDSQSDSCAVAPGATYSLLIQDYTPSGGTDVMKVGDEIGRWTTQAMLGYGLYRYHDGVHDKTIHAGFDEGNSNGQCNSSAHDGTLNSFITSGRHCVQYSDCAADDDRRKKFLVGHEFGHALTALHYGDKAGATNGDEPGADSGWLGITDDNSCANSSVYDITDVEWSSIAFREGFAHFVSAKIFNDREKSASTGLYEGAFHWGGSHSQDLQRPNRGQVSASDNRYDDLCCASTSGCGTGTGVIGDWMRFLWDWYTNEGFLGSCTQQPTKLNMLWLYTRTRQEGGLLRNNYFQKLQDGADAMNLPTCLEDGMLDIHAALNGVDQ